MPAGWEWRLVGTSQPNAATFHVSHSDVGHVKVDVLKASDCPPEIPFVLSKSIPITIMDSLDKFWAGECRTRLPLSGLRVPVEGDTEEEAKQALARDLAAQLRLLFLLATSYEDKMAPELRANLELLKSIMFPREGLGGS